MTTEKKFAVCLLDSHRSCGKKPFTFFMINNPFFLSNVKRLLPHCPLERFSESADRLFRRPFLTDGDIAPARPIKLWKVQITLSWRNSKKDEGCLASTWDFAITTALLERKTILSGSLHVCSARTPLVPRHVNERFPSPVCVWKENRINWAVEGSVKRGMLSSWTRDLICFFRYSVTKSYMG